MFYKNYERRISYAIRKTMKQQSLLLFIICLSCLADQRSPFLNVRLYSQLVLCVVLTSFVIVMVAFPAAIMIYEFNSLLCCSKREKDLSTMLDEVNYQER